MMMDKLSNLKLFIQVFFATQILIVRLLSNCTIMFIKPKKRTIKSRIFGGNFGIENKFLSWIIPLMKKTDFNQWMKKKQNRKCANANQNFKLQNLERIIDLDTIETNSNREKKQKNFLSSFESGWNVSVQRFWIEIKRLTRITTTKNKHHKSNYQNINLFININENRIRLKIVVMEIKSLMFNNDNEQKE